MKKWLLPLLMAVSPVLWAQMGPIQGVGLNVNLESTVYKDTDNNGTTTSASVTALTFQPSLHFFRDEVTEFVPFLTFKNEWDSNPDNFSRSGVPAITDGIYRLSLGGGASLLWHFMNTWRIDMVTGLRGDLLFGLNETGANAPTGESGSPKLFDFDAEVTVPLSMDFILTKQLTLRMTGDLITCGYSYAEETDADTKVTTTNISSSFPFLVDSNAAISVAAIYYFGFK